LLIRQPPTPRQDDRTGADDQGLSMQEAGHERNPNTDLLAELVETLLDPVARRTRRQALDALQRSA
jgi:hypothetical protein